MIHHQFAGMQPKLGSLTYESLVQPEEFSTWCLPWFLLFIHLNIDFNSWGDGGGGGGATFEGWMVCRLQSLISFIFFYSLQGETLYYNTAQQHSLLGDELWVIAFGDKSSQKSDSHLPFSQAQCRSLHAGNNTACANKDLNAEPHNGCLPVIIRSVAE